MGTIKSLRISTYDRTPFSTRPISKFSLSRRFSSIQEDQHRNKNGNSHFLQRAWSDSFEQNLLEKTVETQRLLGNATASWITIGAVGERSASFRLPKHDLLFLLRSTAVLFSFIVILHLSILH